METIIKARKIGSSQGFVLPKQFNLQVGEEYVVKREGDHIIFKPKLKKDNIYKGRAPFTMYTEELIPDQAGKEML